MLKVNKLVCIEAQCNCGAATSITGIGKSETFAALKNNGWRIKRHRKSEPTVTCPDCIASMEKAKAERKAALTIARTERDAALAAYKKKIEAAKDDTA